MNNIKITKGVVYKYRLWQEDCYIEFDGIVLCLVENTYGLTINALKNITIAKLKPRHCGDFLRELEKIKSPN